MIVDDNIFPKVIFGEVAAPGTPAAGTVVVYAKTDGKLYFKDDTGLETQLGAAGGGGGVSVQTVISAATVTPVATNDKVVISAQAVGLTIANPTGTAAEGQGFVIALYSAAAQTIAWGADYRPMGAALLTTTVAGKWVYIPVERNQTDTKWDVFAASQQA